MLEHARPFVTRNISVVARELAWEFGKAICVAQVVYMNLFNLLIPISETEPRIARSPITIPDGIATHAQTLLAGAKRFPVLVLLRDRRRAQRHNALTLRKAICTLVCFEAVRVLPTTKLIVLPKTRLITRLFRGAGAASLQTICACVVPEVAPASASRRERGLTRAWRHFRVRAALLELLKVRVLATRLAWRAVFTHRGTNHVLPGFAVVLSRIHCVRPLLFAGGAFGIQ